MRNLLDESREFIWPRPFPMTNHWLTCPVVENGHRDESGSPIQPAFDRQQHKVGREMKGKEIKWCPRLKKKKGRKGAATVSNQIVERNLSIEFIWKGKEEEEEEKDEEELVEYK
jgi:hypothetical protein